MYTSRRERGLGTFSSECGLEAQKIAEQPWLEPRARRPAQAQRVMFYQNGQAMLR